MEFRVLGPFEVVSGGEALALGSAQQRALLALLVLRTPEAVSVDRLIDALWGERPTPTAQHAVQVYVSGIRKALRAAGTGAEVRRSASGYGLEVEPDDVDARRFERLLHDGQRVLPGDPDRALSVFTEALALWRGPPLVEFERYEPARREADRLDELRTLVEEGVAEARLARGQHAEVIPSLTRLVAASPLSERPRRLLMLALYRAGRHAEALAAYRDARDVLDAIGLEPGPELRRLEQLILRHDPSLQAAPAAVADEPASVGLPREAPTPRQTRKLVTSLCCEVTGAAGPTGELDPEVVHEVLSRCLEFMQATIRRHGGTIGEPVGDAAQAVFGIPTVREDDAVRALRAAAEIRTELPGVAAASGASLSFRAAINSGLVLTGEGDSHALGDAVNVARHLQQAAQAGEILLGEETRRLARDAVEVEPASPLVIPGRSTPIAAFRLLDLDPLAPGIARHLDAPIVGRDRELRLLRSAWERTVEESGCHLFTLLGAAGVGKSRLVAEMLVNLGDGATVVGGRCLPYGEGITFWPLIEALKQLGPPAEAMLERLQGGGAAAPSELFWEFRRLVETIAAERPVVVHIDDLQWAEPMLLDLIDHIAELSRGAPILLLCTGRPELLEIRAAWGGGKLNATTMLLEPLSAGACESLLDHLGDGMRREDRARLVAGSEGNPLFLEEMVALARERGTVSVPPTIQALLMARIEALTGEERELLERGAIEGQVFHCAPVRALVGDPVASMVRPRLAALVRKELIRPHPATLRGDDAFRFRHLLIRDAAYQGLPKATRGALHEQFAGWLEGNARELAEFDEIVGWHLEQTVRYRRELGREVDPDLARRAAEHLQAAGRRARDRTDVAAATKLLERAHEMAAGEESVRARIGVDLAEQLVETLDLARADGLLSDAERIPGASDSAAVVRLQWMMRAQPERFRQTIGSALPRVVERLSGVGDERGLARAHMAAFQAQWLPGQAVSAAEHARLSAEHARRAGDEGLRSVALAWYVATLVHGPENARRIAARLDAIEAEEPRPYLAARVTLARAHLARMAGDFARARVLAQHAIERGMALGMPMQTTGAHGDLAEIERLNGENRAALALLLTADRIFDESGEQSERATIQAMLARIHERLGDPDAARGAIALSDRFGATDDQINYTITHSVRARLALAQGDASAAERWARSAVEHASRTDFVAERAEAQLELARVLMGLGRRRDATLEARSALELLERKGDEPRAAQARSLLDELRGPTRPTQPTPRRPRRRD